MILAEIVCDRSGISKTRMEFDSNMGSFSLFFGGGYERGVGI